MATKKKKYEKLTKAELEAGMNSERFKMWKSEFEFAYPCDFAMLDDKNLFEIYYTGL